MGALSFNSDWCTAVSISLYRCVATAVVTVASRACGGERGVNMDYVGICRQCTA